MSQMYGGKIGFFFGDGVRGMLIFLLGIEVSILVNQSILMFSPNVFDLYDTRSIVLTFNFPNIRRFAMNVDSLTFDGDGHSDCRKLSHYSFSFVMPLIPVIHNRLRQRNRFNENSF
jgi:hypothetical protein